MRITDLLRGEHAAMRALLRQIRAQTASSEGMSCLVVKTNARALWTLIRAHTAVEEPLLNLLANSNQGKIVKDAQHALDEHEEIGMLSSLPVRAASRRSSIGLSG